MKKIITQKKKKSTSLKTITPSIIYQAKNGAIELRGDTTHETVWASQAQIAEVFDVERSVITKHINNLLKSGEIDEKSNVQKMHIANSDKPVTFYSLDVILSVGYRTNSKIAIEFRKWATGILKQYTTQGFVINRNKINQNYTEFMKMVESVQSLLPEHVTLDPKDILELVKSFATTWVSLDAYDKESLETIGSTKRSVTLHASELYEAFAIFKTELMKKGEATELFGQERTRGSIEGIIGNVMQSFGGKSVYPSIEEKSARLLYFIVKNHPFSDGNKRSGAFAFIWFMRKMKLKTAKNINPAALTALTLLIAESHPSSMEQMVALVTHMLRK
jgi:prophage maintenance system killer protein/prophage antirepressor-like protein